MTIKELEEIISTQKSMGLDRAVLAMPMPKSLPSRYPKRVKTPFGLCEWGGGYNVEHIMIYPKVAQLERYVARAKSQLQDEIPKFETKSPWVVLPPLIK